MRLGRGKNFSSLSLYFNVIYDRFIADLFDYTLPDGRRPVFGVITCACLAVCPSGVWVFRFVVFGGENPDIHIIPRAGNWSRTLICSGPSSSSSSTTADGLLVLLLMMEIRVGQLALG